MLEAALRALQQGNVNIGVLQEKKLTQGIHTQHGAGYDVWETEEKSQSWGDIAVAFRVETG